MILLKCPYFCFIQQHWPGDGFVYFDFQFHSIIVSNITLLTSLRLRLITFSAHLPLLRVTPMYLNLSSCFSLTFPLSTIVTSWLFSAHHDLRCVCVHVHSLLSQTSLPLQQVLLKFFLALYHHSQVVCKL